MSHHGGHRPKKTKLAKEANRPAVDARIAARAERTAKEQLKLLDQKLGKELGAKKERARLLAEIEKA